MLLKFFRGSGPGEVLLIILVVGGVWLNAFINPHMAAPFHYDTYPMPLYGLLKTLTGGNSIYGVVFSFSVVLLISFLLVNFNTSHFFINERTFLPAAIYVLLSGLFPQYQLLNPVLPAAVLLILAIRRIMDAYRKPGVAYNFFDSSLLIGIGSLFYANLVWFGILTIIGIAILRTGNIKELIISLFGLITPALFTVGIYYAVGKDISSLPELLYYNLFAGTGEYFLSGIIYIVLSLLGIIILISLFYLLSQINRKKIKAGKTFSLLIWTLILSFGVFFLIPSASFELIFIALVPISYILTHYFIFREKKLVPEICFAVLFLAVIFMQVSYLR
jgi:hypothetical protein